MRTVAVIPARMASTRFPGKPLANLRGLPLIEHVRRRVALSERVSDVIVATCDREIADVVTTYGGRVAMTASTHLRCTDRVAEAARTIDADLILNVQGDEPLVRPEMFEPLVDALEADPVLGCANLMAELQSEAEYHSADVVKTVIDRAGNALYFSREALPSARKAAGVSFQKYKQLGIIIFRKEFLARFSALPPTPLEIVESVDMLRALECGYDVRMVPTTWRAIGVDTPADLERAAALMAGDDLAPAYCQMELNRPR